MKRWSTSQRLAALLLLCGTTFVHAEVRLHPLFSDHAVLQRDATVKVWGTASPGERVTLKFNDQEKSAEAGPDGKWSAALSAMPAGGPYTLTVQGTNTIEVKDVLVGEVWVASGQSNMHMPVRSNKPWSDGVIDHEKEIASANWPAIRMLEVERTFAEAPAETLKGSWTVCSPQTVGDYSGTAYFFARKLHQELNVPVGVVLAAVGATGSSAWTSRDVLERDPGAKAKLAQYDERVRRYPQELAAYEAAAEKLPNGKPTINDPKRPKDPRQSIGSPALLFNGMIAPLMPCTIRGVIWYQGESNSQWPDTYAHSMRMLIEDWRARWKQGDFPFLFVQLSARGPRNEQPVDSNWARIREQQTKTLAVPNTGMAVTIDVGSATTVHPPNKQPVGDRLARVALAKVYGRSVPFAGPMYRAMKVEGNAVRLEFDHADSGLKAVDGALTGFSVAGEGRKFVWADARIEGDAIIVSSPTVSKPIAVRYAWSDNPPCNLFNGEGLPASPFRTDDWPSTVERKPPATRPIEN